jgi:FkbM family methyltransferase
VSDYQIVAGIALPARDRHFAERLPQAPQFDGCATYQLAKLDRALEHCPRRGVAVDVGAQVGLWARVLAARFERVEAIEPAPEHAECLRRNTAGWANVQIHEIALGEAPGRLPLQRIAGVATALVCPQDCDADFWVPACRLDDLGLGPMDFLKIDCEGYEYFVVAGGERTIRRDRPVIVIEQKKRYVARYGLDRRQPAVKLLQSWGAVEFWAKAGDHCLGWVA